MSKALIGIDIGASRLKLALCQPGAVTRLAAEPLPDKLLRDGRIVSPEAMAAFLRETADGHRVSGRRAAVVLPSSQVYTRRTVLPAMTVDQLRLNLPYEFRDYITQEKDKYFYDYALLDMEKDEQGQPRQMSLMIAAVLKSTIQEYSDICRWAKLKLVQAIPEELAYSNLLRLYEAANPKAAGQEHCIIDLGHTATRIYIYTGSRFEANRVIDYGGVMLDQAVADAFHVDEHIARMHKEANHNGEQELEACQAVYRAIAVEIMRAINFYGYNTPGSQLSNGWLCGGGSLIAPLVQQLSETLSLRLRPITEILPADGSDGEQPMLYPAAIGVTQQ